MNKLVKQKQSDDYQKVLRSYVEELFDDFLHLKGDPKHLASK